jgi:transcriptional regulator GlxA family with amidase domain
MKYCQLCGSIHDMVRSVAVLAFDGIAAFELGVVCEVFGTDRTADGFPGYEFLVCSVDGKPIRTQSGFDITPHSDLTPLGWADLVVVPAHPVDSVAPEAALEALRAADARGARLLSVCSGAFVLGQAGLLDAAELSERFPAALIDPSVLYVADGNLLTSAGTAAGIDACLHLVREVHGSAVATKLARRMVVPPHRDGGQSQYVETPLPDLGSCDSLEPLLAWLVAHLDEQITVEDLSARAHMAPRTFARRFKAETGETPHVWLTAQRVLLARHLLEESDLPVDSVASRSGFGDAANLRHHFTQRVGATPQAYRRTFRAS